MNRWETAFSITALLLAMLATCLQIAVLGGLSQQPYCGAIGNHLALPPAFWWAALLVLINGLGWALSRSRRDRAGFCNPSVLERLMMVSSILGATICAVVVVYMVGAVGMK